MKLVVISDTHCQQFPLPDGDVLIHCGDHTYRGTVPESEPALQWLADQPHKHKLIIAGNHELGWEQDLQRNHYRPVPISVPTVVARYPSLTYLHDSGIEINGVKFWGSPYQPQFMNWAFQKARGPELARHWEQIPDDTDVLITHGPPYGFGDTNKRDERFGDEDLLRRVRQVRPDLHLFGHAHDGYGQWLSDGTLFVNAAILNENYKLANKPVEINYQKTETA